MFIGEHHLSDVPTKEVKLLTTSVHPSGVALRLTHSDQQNGSFKDPLDSGYQ